MDNSNEAIRQVPKAILRKLGAVRRTERRVQFVTVGFKVLAFIVVLFAVAMALDAILVLFSPAAGWGLTAAMFVLVAIALAMWGVRPLLKRIQLGSLAHTVD
ncbi:MAG: hypothetical protein ABF370_03745 [Verrucomicrobiales bacterium]